MAAVLDVLVLVVLFAVVVEQEADAVDLRPLKAGGKRLV